MQSTMEVKRYSPGLQQYVDEKPIDMYLIASVGGMVEVFAIVHIVVPVYDDPTQDRWTTQYAVSVIRESFDANELSDLREALRLAEGIIREERSRDAVTKPILAGF